MKHTIEFYMKGENKQTKSFDTIKEYQTFFQALSINPNCEAYGRARSC